MGRFDEAILKALCRNNELLELQLAQNEVRPPEVEASGFTACIDGQQAFISPDFSQTPTSYTILYQDGTEEVTNTVTWEPVSYTHLTLPTIYSV